MYDYCKWANTYKYVVYTFTLINCSFYYNNKKCVRNNVIIIKCSLTKKKIYTRNLIPAIKKNTC